MPTRVPFKAIVCRAWPVPRVIIPRMTIPRVIIPRVTIPRVAQDELHEMCIFHAMRKRGPRSHVMGLFKYLSCCHACKNEVIIERYCSLKIYSHMNKQICVLVLTC